METIPHTQKFITLPVVAYVDVNSHKHLEYCDEYIYGNYVIYEYMIALTKTRIISITYNGEIIAIDSSFFLLQWQIYCAEQALSELKQTKESHHE